MKVDWAKVLDVIRGLVRPLLSLSFAGIILALTWHLVNKFSDRDLANQFSMFVLATGSTIIGFWFASRQKK